jgi:hypothetical protein
MSTVHQISDSHSTSLVTRTLDAVDRTHAAVAMRVHGLRNNMRATVESGLDKAEAAIARARELLVRADERSADAVNRAQGVVGQAIERLRHSRMSPEHLTH